MGYLILNPVLMGEIFHKPKKNHSKMKKLFIVLAVASLGFVACNNESETSTTAPDTTTTVTPAAPAPDSVTVPLPDSATVAVPDTTKK